MAGNRQTSKRVPCIAITAAVILTVALVLGIVLGLTLQTKGDVDPRYVQLDALIDCLPGKESTKEKCEQRGCEWASDPSAPPSRPNCVYPPSKTTVGYSLQGNVVDDEHGVVFNLKRANTPTLYGKDVDTITVAIECQEKHRIHVKIYDPNNARFEVPNLDIPHNKVMCNTSLYRVDYVTTPNFGIQISRESTGETIFNTSLPGLTFSDQFLRVTTRLPSPHVYGFGEHNHRRYKHDMKWKKWTIFAAGDEPVDAWNLYGHHPFYMNLENDGNANGVFLKNSNAMDIILQPDPFPSVSYRVIGGILDFYIFLGPTPENLVQQYTEAVGRPMMPPYWSLGFQLSRWDYGNLTNVKEVVRRNVEAKIPLDVQYGDIDYMYDHLDFTYDREKFAGLPDFIDELHGKGMRYIIILDPGIGTNPDVSTAATPSNSYPPLTVGLEKNVFIRDPRPGNHSYQGYLHAQVWPGDVLFPDFSHPNATEYWRMFVDDFYFQQNIKFDALWIDMNEPKSFIHGSLTGCDRNGYNYPPYLPNVIGSEPDGKLFYKTTCMDAMSEWGRQYDTHSLYGHSMSIVCYNALRQIFPQKRPLVLTRSSFSGSGKYAGHWLGDNQSQWRQLPWSIPGMLEFGLFGFPYIGADICGFWYDTTEELCMRWMLLGAFYPFSRNHNARGYSGKPNFKDQDPAAFGEDMIRVSRDILHTRYKLLPFLYTLFHHAHTEGSTVVRPLLHEFTKDSNTWDIDTQFLWGPSLMISPALNKGQTTVEVYFPNARWYDIFDLGKEITTVGRSQYLDTPVDKINVHLRGGYIIPWQESAVTTTHSRIKPMGITVALDDQYMATGDMFWDDGESFETYTNGSFLMVNFECSVDTIDLKVTNNGYAIANTLVFDTIDVWGLTGQPTRIRVDGIELGSNNIKYYPSRKSLSLVSIGLNITTDHTITWGY